MSTAQPARSGTLAGSSATMRARTSSGRAAGAFEGIEAQPATSALLAMQRPKNDRDMADTAPEGYPHLAVPRLREDPAPGVPQLLWTNGSTCAQPWMLM